MISESPIIDRLSIWNPNARMRMNVTATGALGTMPARMRNRLAGRWVYTIVLTNPMRAARRADTS